MFASFELMSSLSLFDLDSNLDSILGFILTSIFDFVVLVCPTMKAIPFSYNQD